MKRFLLFVCLSASLKLVYGQDTCTVLTLYHEWNEALLYCNDSIRHTAFKPALFADTLIQAGRRSLLSRKLFEEHQVSVHDGSFHLFADFLPDFQVGISKRPQKVPWQNTRGVSIMGNIGSKVYFEAEDFETQQRFPGYVDSFVRSRGMIPRLDTYRKLANFNHSVADFNYTSARLVYMPDRFLLVDLGYGRNFIGDGYRSLLLSDWAFNYPYLQVSGKWRSLQYSVMWSQYISKQGARAVDTFSYPRKWSQTFFLDWHFLPAGNIGLFESVIWPGQTVNHRNDMSWSLLSPLIFLHGNASPSGISNFTLTGLNARFRIMFQTFLYGQAAVSNFLRNSAWKDRFAFQLGLRSFDFAGVRGLDALAEFNKVKPYMYAGNSPGINYSQFDQPLADPLGAAFKEGVAVLHYKTGKWWFRLEALKAIYTSDQTSEENAGGDILKPVPIGNSIPAQGMQNHLLWTDFRAAFILNRENNLRLEAGVTFRKESNHMDTFRDCIFMLGFRSTFRDLIRDF